MLNIVNHHLWFDDMYWHDDHVRILLKWGHYPEVDGKIEPKIFEKLTIIDDLGREVSHQVGIDKDSSSKGGLFLEFKVEKNRAYTIAVTYDRGIYSKTRDGKWCFGDKRSVQVKGYQIDEAYRLRGCAKTHISTGMSEFHLKPLGLDFELYLPTFKNFHVGDEIELKVLYEGTSLPNIDVNVRTRSGVKSFRSDDEGYVKFKLEDKVTVITSTFRDYSKKISEIYDTINFSTSLTIIAMGD